MGKDTTLVLPVQTTGCIPCNKTKPVCPPVDGVGGVQAQVPAVVARAITQILAEAVVPFPALFPATEIVQTIKRVRDLNVTVCRNKVLINGILDVNVVYKTLEGNYTYRQGGVDPSASFGDVKQIGFEIPFAGFADAHGARLGDDFIVNFAGVENECQIETLEDRIDCPTGPDQFRSVRVRAVILVDLSVIRNVLIPIRDLTGGVSPLISGRDAE